MYLGVPKEDKHDSSTILLHKVNFSKEYSSLCKFQNILDELNIIYELNAFKLPVPYLFLHTIAYKSMTNRLVSGSETICPIKAS